MLAFQRHQSEEIARSLSWVTRHWSLLLSKGAGVRKAPCAPAHDKRVKRVMKRNLCVPNPNSLDDCPPPTRCHLTVSLTTERRATGSIVVSGSGWNGSEGMAWGTAFPHAGDGVAPHRTGLGLRKCRNSCVPLRGTWWRHDCFNPPTTSMSRTLSGNRRSSMMPDLS